MFTQTSCRNIELGVMTAIVQLSFFEVLSRPCIILCSNNTRSSPTTAMPGWLICAQQ